MESNQQDKMQVQSIKRCSRKSHIDFWAEEKENEFWTAIRLTHNKGVAVALAIAILYGKARQGALCSVRTGFCVRERYGAVRHGGRQGRHQQQQLAAQAGKHKVF